MITKLGPRENGRKTKSKKKHRLKQQSKSKIKYIKKIKLSNFKEVDHIHFFGYYIGNYPSLNANKVKKICSILNSINYEF